MVGYIYKKCFEVLKKKPLHLWGISLLNSLLSVVACVFGILPVIIIPIVFVLSAGMALVFLNGYRGKEPHVPDLFEGFKKIGHVLGGMSWMVLWIFLWTLIPVVGIVFAIIKGYEYRFTPYILMTKPEIPAIDAIKESKKMTYGFKGKMFFADFFVGLCVSLIFTLLIVLGTIPNRFISIFFLILYFLFAILYLAFGPLFLGLVNAAFYEEAPHYQPKSALTRSAFSTPCRSCGYPLEPGARFCPGCGKPVDAPPPAPTYAPPPNTGAPQ